MSLVMHAVDVSELANELPGHEVLAEATSIPIARDILLWMDSVAARPVKAERVWNTLFDGRCFISDAFCDDDRAYMVLSPRLGEPLRARSRWRQEDFWQRLLLGQSQKAMAIELGITPSTVALALSRDVRALGLTCRAQNVPLAMVLVGQANYGAISWEPRLAVYEVGEQCHQVVSLLRPDRVLPDMLSKAEQAVTRQVIEGTTREDAARVRGTSKRTVANQQSGIFKKLNAVSRFHLVHLLASGSLTQPVVRWGASSQR